MRLSAPSHVGAQLEFLQPGVQHPTLGELFSNVIIIFGGPIIAVYPKKNSKKKKKPNKLWYIYIMEFFAAQRKKELIPFLTAWMELESIMLSEISQTVRDKYHMISPLTGT